MTSLDLTLTRAAEDELLEYWNDAFEWVYGEPVVLRDTPGGGRTMTFPNVIRPIEMIGGTGHFGRYPVMVEHLRSLGFDWGDGDRVLTVPTPLTFNANVDAAVGRDSGWRLAFRVEDTGQMALGPFLDSYLGGAIPVHASTRDYYARMRTREDGRRSLEFAMGSVAHDLSVHALNYHLVPRVFIDEIRAAFADAMPDRVAAWAQPGARAPLTVGYFLDNDLNRYCYSVWYRTSKPSDFGPLFADNFEQLRLAQRIRIEETLAGIGDVPSGDTNDMAPLRHVEFQVR